MVERMSPSTESAIPEWNDLPNECKESLRKVAGWYEVDDWHIGQCALDMYNELRKTLPAQVFPLFQSSDGGVESRHATIPEAGLAAGEESACLAGVETRPAVGGSALLTRAGVAPGPSEAIKSVYVKRWRTIVKLPAKYADEIVEALRFHGDAQCAGTSAETPHATQAEPVAYLVDWQCKKSDDAFSAGGGSCVHWGHDKDEHKAHIEKLRALDFVERITLTPLFAGTLSVMSTRRDTAERE